MRFLTEETRTYLGDLLRDELHNSYAYQYISSFLSTQGLDNFSEFFKYRAREEMKHAEMIRGFCEEMDIMLDFGRPIEGFSMSLNNISDFCKLAYDLEAQTTERFERLFDMCFLDGNSRIFIELAEEFLKEQHEELTWAAQLVDYANNLGNDRGAWQRFDRGFDPESYGLGIGGDDDD